MSDKVIRIGGGSGYWGDAAMATPQLLAAGGLDYIVYDYLAEITMSIMARARLKNSEAGYATDFVTATLQPNLKDIAAQGVKIIANAGGVNPASCGAKVRELIAEQGLALKVATILGDDLSDRAADLAKAGYEEMYSEDTFPEGDRVLSVNAYLGAFPIARALAQGADIVITGRSVDSAVTLGALIHEFDWSAEDLDPLAGGSLAGHILECGPQTTGGNFTDWETVADTIDHIGYPIAEVKADGSFICTKPDGTGGTVNVGTVSEQMLYEIGDPQAYMLPDVVCDFSRTKISQDGEDRVLVSGTKGAAAPDSYKVSTTFTDGFRGGTYMTFYGLDAELKAKAFAAGALKRARNSLRSSNLGDYTETSLEIIGAESQFGAAREIEAPREVVMKLAAKHPEASGIGIMLKEMTGLGLATPPGLSGFAGARARPSPVVRLFSFAIPKNEVGITVEVDGAEEPFQEAPGQLFEPANIQRPQTPEVRPSGETVAVPLVKLAWARSGDKGNKANVGVIARKSEYLPYIWQTFTEQAVAGHFAHFLEGEVERYLMPGSNAINFLLHDVLGGGGVASLRNDPQAKGYSQILLAQNVEIPKAMAEAL